MARCWSTPAALERAVSEGRPFPEELGGQRPLAPGEVVQLLLAQPEGIGELETTHRPLDPITQPLREVGREHRALPRADQLLERAPLRVGEPHASMLGGAPDMPETPDDILRALADPERLAIAGLLARGSAEARDVAEELGVPLKRVRTHLNRLTSAGVTRLQEDRRSYRLDRETLRWAAEQVGPPRDAGLPLGAANESEEAVLRTFFREGRLLEIPTKQAKRRIVLERIAVEFEPGVSYDEREVNVVLARFFPDHAALRRYLVDEGFLERDHGRYWRVGGRVDVDD